MPGKLIRGDSQCKWEVNEKWKVVERKIIPWENRPIVNEKWIQRISFAWSRERKRNESQRIFFCGSLFQLVFLFSRNYWRFANIFLAVEPQCLLFSFLLVGQRIKEPTKRKRKRHGLHKKILKMAKLESVSELKNQTTINRLMNQRLKNKKTNR